MATLSFYRGRGPSDPESIQENKQLFNFCHYLRILVILKLSNLSWISGPNVPASDQRELISVIIGLSWVTIIQIILTRGPTNPAGEPRI